MKSKLLLTLLLASGGFSAIAQQQQKQQQMMTSDAPAASPDAMTLGVYAGSQGFGLEFRRKVATNWNVRFGGGYLPWNAGINEKISEVSVHSDYKTSFTNIHALAEYQLPFWKKIDFRLVGGLAYFVSANVKGTVTPKGDYYYGDIQLNDENMGEIKVDAEWTVLAPYLGVGLFRIVPTKKLNVNLDLGTYYFVSAPRVNMETSGYLAGNQSNSDQLADNLKSYRWLPVLQLTLNYKLHQ
jgi:hypothetical protein